MFIKLTPSWGTEKKKIFIVFDAFLIYFQFSEDLGMKVLEDMAM